MKVSLSLLVFLLLSACETASKKLEMQWTDAQSYLAPLSSYRSVVCTAHLQLPESFKAVKRQDKTSKPKVSWNQLFATLESHSYGGQWTRGDCAVRGFNNIKGKESLDSSQTQFLESLESQVKLGNCILLKNFFYGSPLAGPLLKEYSLEAYPQKPGFKLVSYRNPSAR
ncbi:MAG: hypothetical protein KDD22_03780, partial [Bdellovibrionales bacterium]|nr:hypothetical protein [Bdellovibrionales bacterium]